MNWLIKLRESHRFFVDKSRWFVGNQNRLVWCNRGLSTRALVPQLSTKQGLYYPIAYTKFMWYEITDK